MPTSEVIDEFLRNSLYGDPGFFPERIEKARAALAHAPEIAGANVYTAAATGHVEALQGFIEADGHSATERGGPRGWSPLLYLCYSRIEDGEGRSSVAAARLLLKHGADARDHYKWAGKYHYSALTGVMGEGEGGVEANPPHAHAGALAELLLDAGADPNESQGLYNTIFTPDNTWLEFFLERGLKQGQYANWEEPGSITTVDFQLGYAVNQGMVERVRLLLEHGANPDAVDHYDHRPALVNAERKGHDEIAQLLREAGALSQKEPADDLFVALRLEQWDEAQRLLAARVELAQDSETLRELAQKGNKRAVELYLEFGADMNGRGRFGSTVLQGAAFGGQREVVHLLLERGAQIEKRDWSYDGTAVGWAKAGGHPQLACELLDRSRDVFGLAHHGRLSQLKALLSEEPSAARQVVSEGSTPLDSVGKETEHKEEIEALLRAHGAWRTPEGLNDDDVPSPINLRDQEGAAKWAKQAENHPHRVPFREEFARALAELAPSPRRILELGSGPGWLAERILSEFDVEEYVLFDFSEPMQEMARQRLKGHKSARFVLGTFKSQEWPDVLEGAFDAVLAQQSVHEIRHKKHHQGLYERVLRVLKPGGLLVLSDRGAVLAEEPSLSLYASDEEQHVALNKAGYVAITTRRRMDNLYVISARRK